MLQTLSFLNSTKNFLNGKKTYLLVISSIIGLLVSWLDGNVSNGDFVRDFISLLIVSTIRHGITTTLSQDPPKTIVQPTEDKKDDGIKIIYK